MLSILFIVFAIIVGIQSIYYLLFFIKSFSKSRKNKKDLPPISVIICAKNEAENLQKNFTSLINQEYSNNFEIVFINDRSTDNTPEILDQFKEKHKNIKIVTVEECENFWGNKKYALTLGIKAASYEHLLFTDADCQPNSKFWISEMIANFTEQRNIVLGYGGYEKKKRSFLNKLIRYETLLTAIQYFSYAKLGNPYMGVGRNLAYTKTSFFNTNGFIKHIDIKSGDDDLFINEVANNQNTAISLSKDSFTISTPKESFKDWISQKRRHISTAKHYKIKDQLLLGLFYFGQVSFWVLAILLCSIQYKIETVLILVGLRFFVFYLAIGFFAKRLNEKDLIILAPFTEITLIFMQLLIFIKNKINAPKHW